MATRSKPLRSTRLNLEFLEGRDNPSTTGNVSGTLIFNTLSVAVGASVRLAGESNLGVPVDTTAVSDATGSYRFSNILAGTYTLTATSTPGIKNNGTATATVTVVPDTNTSKNLTLTGGLLPTVLSMRLFLNVPDNSSFNARPGTGDAAVNSRPNQAPTVVSGAFSDVSTPIDSAPLVIDLAGKFADTDLTNFPGQEKFTYTVSSTNPELVTGVISGDGNFDLSDDTLTLTYASGKSGTADIYVVAKDQFGVTASQKFSVEVTGGTLTRANVAPSTSNAIANISQQTQTNADSKLINLAGKFTDADITNSEIQFNIVNGGTPSAVKFTLYDKTAPQTVANFFDYIDSGDYNNAIFTRLASGFVLQGGASKINSTGTTITAKPNNELRPPVPNEFGVSNEKYTVAMALSGGDINSGTNQFFVNLVDNTSSLDSQSFAVFGKVEDTASQTVIDQLATTPTTDVSGNTAIVNANPGVLLNALPLTNYTGTNFPNDASPDNYMRIESIDTLRRDEKLTYSAISLNTDLVTVSVEDEYLTLNYIPKRIGSAVIVVTATDKFGFSFSQQFTVTLTA